MDFLTYHIESSKIRDIDPANDCLRYISDRFELSEEQRYWLAFLYSTCYCAPTVFYMYNEFPDFCNVDAGRLSRWWKANKSKTIFQTDRNRIKTGDKVVETFQSYRALIGGLSQQERFDTFRGTSSGENYINAYRELGKIRNVGRFTLFLYLEMIEVLTGFKCYPDRIDWDSAENCRQGMIYCVGGEDGDRVSNSDLDKAMEAVLDQLTARGCEHNNIFNVETTLCAYKKYKHGKRYVGFYIDRQEKEIEKIKHLVREGVAWRVLDDFRRETYKHLNKSHDLFSNGSLRDGQDLDYETTNLNLQINRTGINGFV